jgi:hypothetical protein
MDARISLRQILESFFPLALQLVLHLLQLRPRVLQIELQLVVARFDGGPFSARDKAGSS